MLRFVDGFQLRQGFRHGRGGEHDQLHRFLRFFGHGAADGQQQGQQRTQDGSQGFLHDTSSPSFFSLPENGGITNKPPSRLRAAAVSFPKGRLRRFQRQPYAERGRAFMKKARAPKKARGQKRLMQTSPLVHVSFSNAEGRAVSSLTLNRMLRRGPGSIAFATGTGARRQFHYVISGGFLSSNMQKMRI